MGAKKSAQVARNRVSRGGRGTLERPVGDVRAVFPWSRAGGGGMAVGRSTRRVESAEMGGWMWLAGRQLPRGGLLAKIYPGGEKEEDRGYTQAYTLKYVGGVWMYVEQRGREGGTATGWQAHHH